MDRAAFFAAVRKSPFNGTIGVNQASGLGAVLDEWDRRKLTDLRQLASAWVSWSGAELRSFVSAWSSDVELHLQPPGSAIL
jgi:hypothetical protein